jgi:two-component system, NtrC family, C4-dicarboxylate transport response regulator DctD
VPASGPPSLAGVHILIVDDHGDTLDFLQQTLTHEGAAVRAAPSAKAALAALDEVDVIITDYSMPGDSGLWLLERVRERLRPVPVILLTAYADVYATELAGAPFARVLRKPVDPWTLCREVRDVAQGR